MMTFVQRRRFAGVMTLLALIAALVVWLQFDPRDAVYVSGWGLAAMMVFLTLYNLRKKMPYPPMWTSATWLQLHIYIGLLTAPIYLMHAGMRLPTGGLDITLALLFAGVFISGVVGLLLTRVVPRRLSVRGEEVLFERIPVFRRQLLERAEALIVDTVQQTDAVTLSSFYHRRVADFLRRPRHLWRHVIQSTRPLQRLTEQLHDSDRYFNEQERAAAAELAQIIEAKDHLDYHQAMQGVLKGWLFVHIPLTYVLMTTVALHAVLMHTWVGGIR